MANDTDIFGAPLGASKDADIFGDLKGGKAETQAPQFPVVPSSERALPSWTSPEGLAGNPVTRMALGAASPFLGAAQLGANAFGIGGPLNEHLAQLERMKQEGRGQFGSTGFDWTEAAGTMASPAFLKAGQLMPAGMNYLQKILAGTGLGAGAGATAPVTREGDFGSQKTSQIGAGATLGGVLSAAAPAITSPVQAAYHGLIDPWLAPAAIKGRAYLAGAGNKVDEIIGLLRQNKELVPGSAPTAGEAAVPAGSAEFSALQKQAANLAPSDYVARADAQNAARLAALRGVGQDEAALQAAKTARSSAADPLYSAARQGIAPVDTAPIIANVDSILAKNPGNRELMNELTNIRKGLENSGSDPQKVASVIDGLKATIANKDNLFIRGQLNNVKEDLTKAIPGYEAAQAMFAQMSPPINQMQIGQYLEKKLIPALSDEAKQKAGTFATALQEAPATIKRATGAPRFDKLEQALTPDQMSVMQSIQADLARGVRFEDLATKGAQAAPDITNPITSRVVAPGSLALKREVAVFKAIVNRLEGKVNEKLAAEMAVEMLNPPKVGESLAAAKLRAEKIDALQTLLRQSGTTALGGSAAILGGSGSDYAGILRSQAQPNGILSERR